MDLVISIPLWRASRGGLGLPTWLPDRCASDWRDVEREEPWVPTVRILRKHSLVIGTSRPAAASGALIERVIPSQAVLSTSQAADASEWRRDEEITALQEGIIGQPPRMISWELKPVRLMRCVIPPGVRAANGSSVTKAAMFPRRFPALSPRVGL